MKYFAVCLLLVAALPLWGAWAQQPVTADASVDFVSRYVWRGLDIGNTASLQPTVAVNYSGAQFGAWGAYTMFSDHSDVDEIDLWLSYTHAIENKVTLTALVTDYYFPNKGVRFFNFNDYDDPSGAGAHTLEVGGTIGGPEKFPLSFSGFVNVYNDAGNNTYFQLDASFALDATTLDLFVGAAGGSKENPAYYGTDDLEVINLGVTAGREIRVSESFTIPLSVSFILNPEAEIAYLVAGISL